MRCPECGQSGPDGQAECPLCHYRFATVPLAGAPGFNPAEEARRRTAVIPRPDDDLAPSQPCEMQAHPLQAIYAPQAAAPAVEGESAPASGRARLPRTAAAREQAVPRGAVNGRVILMEPPYMEAPDPDPWMILTHLLWIAILLISPVLVFAGVLTLAGGLSAILLIVGMVLLLRLFSFNSIFGILTMFHMLRPGRPDGPDQVPVRYFRVRDSETEAETAIRMKGHYVRGNIMPDDLVSCWGRWRAGTLMARRCYNHRTRAWVHLRQSWSWVYLLLTLAAIGWTAWALREPIGMIFEKIGGGGGLP